MTRADSAAYKSLPPAAQRVADELAQYGSYLTVTDIVDYTGYHRNTVYRQLRKAKIIQIRHRKKADHRIHPLDFAAWWAGR